MNLASAFNKIPMIAATTQAQMPAIISATILVLMRAVYSAINVF
jgi:hypothetical protein